MNEHEQDVPYETNPGTGAARLTGWEKEPTAKELKEDLTAAKPSHDAQMGKIRKWNSLRMVEGEAKPKKLKGRSSVQPKLIRRQAEWRYSALSEAFLSTQDMFDVRPASFEDTEAAEQNQVVLNWQFRTKLNRIKFVDEYVRSTVDEGTCIVRLGWERQTVPEQVQVPVFTHYRLQSQEQAGQLEQAILLKQENPRGYAELDPALQAAVDLYEESGELTFAEISGYELQTEEKIVVNRPTAEVLNPQNVYIDPSCNGDLDKANFVIVSFETSRAELLKDGRYKNLDAINWSGNTILSAPDHATNTPLDFNFQDSLRKKVVAYEYWGVWDIDGSGVLKPIVATWIGDTLIRLEESPFPDGKPPFVMVPYLPVKRELYGEPDAEVLEDNQAILGAVTRGVIDLLGRSANSQQGFAKNFLDVTNKRRFESGQDYEFNPGAGDPRFSVYQHSYPEIPQSALTVMQMQNQDAESLSGVKAFSGGLSGEAYGDVAAGIRGMLDASSKREMNILRRLAKGMRDIGVKIMAMNAVFLSEEETVRVTNKTFVTVRREDLAGNFDLIVDISTAEVDQAKSQDLAFMLQTVGPNMDPGLQQEILAQIADLKRMPDLAERLRRWQPQPDPLEQKLKELEIRKLEAEVRKLESEAAKNMAEADKKQSEKDLADLDYLEQESGTAHERDLQKVSVQGKANQELEVTKAITRPKKPDEQEPNIEAAMGYNALTEGNPLLNGL